MKRRISILFLVFGALLWQAAGAQDADWSNPEKFRSRTAYTRVLGQNSHGIYALRCRNRAFSRKVYVQMYRENMGMVFNKILPGLKNAYFENAFVYNDGMRLFKSQYNRKTREIDLVAQKYTHDAEPTGEEIVVSSSLQRDYSDDGDYVISRSTDFSKIVCFHTEISPSKSTVIDLEILDGPELTVLNRKKVELPFKYASFVPLETVVANNGNAYFIFRVEADDKSKNDFEYLGYYLFTYNAGTDQLTDFYLNTEDTYLSKPHITLDYFNNKVIVNGFYSLENAGNSKGILDFGLDMKSHIPIYHNLLPYPENFVSDVVGRQAAQNGEELRDFYIRKIVPRSDGGYVLLAEEFYTSTQTYTFTVNGMMQMGTRDLYNYGKVGLLSVNKFGEIEWGKVINKSQTSSQDLGYYSSIFVVPLKNSINIFYNDEFRGNSEITQYTLDNNGKLTSKLLFKNQSSSIAVVPREAMQLDAATVLFPTAKDRKFAFLKLLVN
jgi:hypothetical protein